jgi:perosamine synthetase
MKVFETRIHDDDIEIISKVIKSGDIGFGNNVNIFENKFSHFSKKKFNIACNSASAASFMIFSYLKDTYGICDVYTTSLGFTSPTWCAMHFGHNLIFVDVQEDLQFSSEYYKKVRKHTKNKAVVMPVLYGGVSNIDNFNLFGDEIVIVDSAHCVTPTIKSDFVFFSFHPYKPICTSDGGMISTDNKNASEYFKNYRNFGRISLELGYDIESDGFKFYMNNLNATIALTQIKRYEENLKVRKLNYLTLQKKYNLLPHDDKSSFYFATTLTENANHIIAERSLTRNYPMLHKMSYYKSNQRLPRLEKIHHKILNLPLWNIGEIE